jgi:hypothetical protein
MKSLEGGLNPDHLSSERHLYGGAFELDFILFYFRRGIRRAGTGSHIELLTMRGQIMADPTRLPFRVGRPQCIQALSVAWQTSST